MHWWTSKKKVFLMKWSCVGETHLVVLFLFHGDCCKYTDWRYKKNHLTFKIGPTFHANGRKSGNYCSEITLNPGNNCSLTIWRMYYAHTQKIFRIRVIKRWDVRILRVIITSSRLCCVSYYGSSIRNTKFGATQNWTF